MSEPKVAVLEVSVGVFDGINDVYLVRIKVPDPDRAMAIHMDCPDLDSDTQPDLVNEIVIEIPKGLGEAYASAFQVACVTLTDLIRTDDVATTVKH